MSTARTYIALEEHFSTLSSGDTIVWNNGTWDPFPISALTPDLSAYYTSSQTNENFLSANTIANQIGGKILHGFVNRVDSTISMDGALFKITPTSSSYTIYINGVKHVINDTKTIPIPHDLTLHYIYFDQSGNLQSSTTAWSFSNLNMIPCAIVYRKNSSTFRYYDERHSADRDLRWHVWAHSNIGAMYNQGLSGVFTNTSFSISQGVIFDEDIRFDTQTTQNLCTIWFRSGTSMSFVENQSVLWLNSGNTPYYDNNGVLTPVPNDSYFASWVYCANDPIQPIYVVVGQNIASNIDIIRNTGLPTILFTTAEWKLLYRIIWRSNGANNNPTLIEVADYRNVQTGVPVNPTSINSHSSLIDRDAQNSHPSTAISVDTNLFTGLLTGTTNVQESLNILDTHHHDDLYVNINGDVMTGSLIVPLLSATTVSSTTSWFLNSSAVSFTANNIVVNTLTANTISAGTYYGIDNTHTDAYNNVTVGLFAGYSITSASTNNVFVGVNAGYNNINGDNNVYVGYYAGYNNTSGNNNTFIGYYAGYNNNGYDNTFVGYLAGRSNSTGYYNTFVGSYAGNDSSKGLHNTFIGVNAGYGNTEGNYNVLIGSNAGFNVNTGSSNVYIGYRAGYYNVGGNDNVIIGYDSGYSGTTRRSVHIGYESGYRNNGVENIFIGYRSGYLNTIAGSYNSCLGVNSGYKITEGNSNVFFGYQVGYNTTSGSRNNFIGYHAGYNNVGGYDNVYIGYRSGYMNNGINNVFVGNYAGYNTSGNSNVFIGYQAGYYETGSDMLYISNSNTSEPLIKGNFSTNRLMFNADVEIKINQSYYIGPKDTEGTWRISVVDGNLEIAKFTGGTYVVGQTIVI